MYIFYSDGDNNRTNTFYPNRIEITDLLAFKKAVSKDHVMCSFEGNRRSNNNFIETECLYADIDNTHSENPEDWVSIKEFKDQFLQYEFYIATSKSHQIEKDGKAARDKYHVIFPTKQIKGLKTLTYWLKALTTKYPFFDAQVKDAGRFFFGNPDSSVDYNSGASILKDLYGFQFEQKKQTIPLNFDIGNRNDTMFRWACSLHSNGCPDEEIEVFLIALNNQSQNPLKLSEIRSCIRSTHRYEEVKPRKLSDKKRIIKNYYYYDIETKDENGEISKEEKFFKYLDFSEEMKLPLKDLASFQDGSGKLYMFDPTNPGEFITNANQFFVLLSKKGWVLDFGDKGLSENKYLEFCRTNNNLNTYKRFSCLPEVNPKSDTLYDCVIVKPKQTGLFRIMIDTMTFKTIKDRYRFAAGLLSAFLNSDFDGKKPMMSIIATAKSSGKTSAILKAAELIQGQIPLSFRGEKEDENQIAGIESLKNKFILYDNLQYTTKKQMVNITQTITNIDLPSWFMNVSHCRVRNNKTIWATFNSEEGFNDDILNRVLTISMKDGRDLSTKEKIAITESLNEIDKYRDQLMADILWILKQDGRDIEVVEHIKFTKWSKEIAKYLSIVFPEVDVFDFSLSSEDEDLSSELSSMTEFIEDIMEDADEGRRFVTNDEMVQLYRTFFQTKNATKNSCGRHIRNISKSIRGFDIEYITKKVMGKTYKGYEIKIK